MKKQIMLAFAISAMGLMAHAGGEPRCANAARIAGAGFMAITSAAYQADVQDTSNEPISIYLDEGLSVRLISSVDLKGGRAVMEKWTVSIELAQQTPTVAEVEVRGEDGTCSVRNIKNLQ